MVNAMKLKHILIAQIVFIAVAAAMLGAYMRSRGPQASTFIVAPISAATSSMMSAGAALSQHPLINPTVTANLGKHFIIDFKSLEDQIKGIQSRYPQKTYVYFAYLNNSAWIGSHEKTLFTAASTIKVPLAMSIMKSVEEGKLKLSQSYTLSQLDLDENFGNLYKVGADKSFTLQDLLQIMLENSDNTAMNALYKALKLVGIDDPFSDVYQAMGWDYQVSLGEAPKYNQINLKTLSTMFIALYNAQYDNPQDSQMILDYLDNSVFNDQIPAGVPASVSVAHKIGVYDADKTYSDCGIVYAPNRNFLLCLGSQGADQKSANKFMAEVARASYEYVMKN